MIENYVVIASSSSSSSSSANTCASGDDTNRTTNFTYSPDNLPATITAVNATTGNQTTTYQYGTTLTESAVASSLLMRYEILPDSVSGSDQKAFTYNRQNQMTAFTDQNGTIHSYTFDKLGRQTNDGITTVGSGVDNAVLRIAATFEVRGLVQNLTSYDNATVGSGNVVNDVQFAYNSFQQLTADYQSNSGTVNTSTTPKVQYGYAGGSANTIRLTSMTYPNGRVLNSNYGVAGGINDSASRIASLIDNDGTTHLVDYSYLGLAEVIQVNEPQPAIQFTLIGTQGGNDPVTGDIYRGLDLFRRIKDLIWAPSSSGGSSSSSSSGASSNLVEIQHAYDRASNRLFRKDVVAGSMGKAFDELYSYDGLYRLKSMQRGTLNAGNTSITTGTGTFGQCWTLDTTGNWKGFREDDTGSGTWNLIQNRIANSVNEITAISNSTGPSWIQPAYNLVGNMTTIPQPASPGSRYTGTYDAWNRLVKLVDPSTGQTVQTDAYDGRKYRTIRNSFTAGVLSETRHYFHTSTWQVIEERLGSSSNPNRQFVWGQRFIDDLILRDRDTTGGGILNERLYALQDPLGSVVAVANSSGVIQERYAYSPYGAPQILSSAFAVQSSSTFAQETLFGGYRIDSATSLYVVRNRIFNYATGTWITQDPAGYVGSRNLYEYTNNSPLSRLDPSGLIDVDDCTLMWGMWWRGIGQGYANIGEGTVNIVAGTANMCANVLAINPVSACVGDDYRWVPQIPNCPSLAGVCCEEDPFLRKVGVIAGGEGAVTLATCGVGQISKLRYCRAGAAPPKQLFCSTPRPGGWFRSAGQVINEPGASSARCWASAVDVTELSSCQRAARIGSTGCPTEILRITNPRVLCQFERVPYYGPFRFWKSCAGQYRAVRCGQLNLTTGQFLPPTSWQSGLNWFYEGCALTLDPASVIVPCATYGAKLAAPDGPALE